MLRGLKPGWAERRAVERKRRGTSFWITFSFYALAIGALPYGRGSEGVIL